MGNKGSGVFLVLRSLKKGLVAEAFFGVELGLC